MSRYPTVRDAITETLNSCGPMTTLEIAQLLGWSRYKVHASITRARENHPGKFFRVTGYQRQDAIQGREARVFAAGPGPDASRPPFANAAERKSRYYLRNRARFALDRKRRAGAAATNPWAGLVLMERRSA